MGWIESFWNVVSGTQQSGEASMHTESQRSTHDQDSTHTQIETKPACLRHIKSIESSPASAFNETTAANMGKTGETDQNSELEKDKQTLFLLIRVTENIEGHLDALDYAWMLSSPSQQFPKRVNRLQKLAEKQFGSKSSEDILIAAKQSEIVAAKTFSELMGLSQRLYPGQTPYDVSSSLTKEDEAILRDIVNRFSSQTKTCLSERVLLQDRGIVMPPVKFKISHALISEQIHELQTNKTTVRDKISDLLGKMHRAITDLIRGRYPEKAPSASHIESPVLSAIEETQAALSRGAKAEALAKSAEQIALEKVDSYRIREQDAAPDKAKPTIGKENMVDEAGQDTETQAPRTFLQKLGLWLNSSWKTKWKDL